MYNYPYWKILAWRFIRTGISSGISMVTVMNITIKPDWSNVNVLFATTSAAFVSGFISAVALAIRDYLSEGDKTSKIQKIPV